MLTALLAGGVHQSIDVGVPFTDRVPPAPDVAGTVAGGGPAKTVELYAGWYQDGSAGEALSSSRTRRGPAACVPSPWLSLPAQRPPALWPSSQMKRSATADPIFGPNGTSPIVIARETATMAATVADCDTPAASRSRAASRDLLDLTGMAVPPAVAGVDVHRHAGEGVGRRAGPTGPGPVAGRPRE